MDMRRVTMAALSFLTLSILSVTGGPGSASAALRPDPHFGKGGIARVPGHRPSTGGARRAVPEVMAEEPDGDLIVRDGGTLQRLGPSGRLDPEFGDEGTVAIEPVAGGSFFLTGAAVDPQGRIIIVGTSTPPQPHGALVETNFLDGEQPPVEAAHSDARVLRLLPDGKHDPTFGRDGVLETDLGLPTPEYEGVKLASAPAIDTTGVAVDGAGKIIVTGGAVAGLASSCYHDDFGATLSDAAFVARLTASGEPDTSFGKDGVFGGVSLAETPLKLEIAGSPTVTPEGGIAFRQAPSSCGRGVGTSPGYVRLDRDGKISAYGTRPRGNGADAMTLAPDGSTLLLIEPLHYWQEPEFVEKLLPDGAPDPSFGRQGRVELGLSKWSYVDRLAVTSDGEVLVGGVDVPNKKSGTRGPSSSRSSIMLIGLEPDGVPDRAFGPNGIGKVMIPGWYRWGGLFVDSHDRPTITVASRPKAKAPIGLAAVRFGAL
jgi:uncharacterized delta-60 repeat protein